MLYPEEHIAHCRRCRIDIPADCCWRGNGSIISRSGREHRTALLHSMCPRCGERQSVGLPGVLLYRAFYGWLWKLRYPRVCPPALDFDAYQPARRRASGE